MKLTANLVVKMVLFGAGNRGKGVFGQYALDMPHRVGYVAVVEPDEEKRNAFAIAHKIPESMRFSQPEDFFTNTVQ